MAKNESSILAGLNFGAPAVQPAPEKEPEVKEEKKVAAPVEEKPAPAPVVVEEPVYDEPEEDTAGLQNSMKSAYSATFKNKKRMTRSVRTTISLTPRIYDRMTQATENGEIKSANDLINYLLEQYFQL